MSPHGTQENMGKILRHEEMGYEGDQWRRWDEELVEDFGRWLRRLAKALAISLLAVSATILIKLLWQQF